MYGPKLYVVDAYNTQCHGQAHDDIGENLIHLTNKGRSIVRKWSNIGDDSHIIF